MRRLPDGRATGQSGGARRQRAGGAVADLAAGGAVAPARPARAFRGAATRADTIRDAGGPTPGGGATSAREANIVEEWVRQQQEANAPKPIGVPPGHERGGQGLPFEQRPAVNPLYVEGDEWFPTELSRDDLIALQARLRSLGLLKPPYLKGVYDPATRQAYEQLLGYANVEGVDWTTALDRLATTEMIEDDPLSKGVRWPSFRPQNYRAPNAAAVANDLRDLWQQRLGREIRPDEEAEFLAAFTQMHREAHDIEQGVARAEFEQDQQADIRELSAESGLPVEAITPARDDSLPPVGNVNAEQTDPGGNFAALVNEHMRREEAGSREAAETLESQNLVSSVIGGLRGFVRSS